MPLVYLPSREEILYGLDSSVKVNRLDIFSGMTRVLFKTVSVPVILYC